MPDLGPISFAAPAALLALGLLPAIWWLLRVTPPTPLRLRFPPVRLLLQLVAREQSVQKTPLWLLWLRLALAALLILAAARPLLDAARPLPGAGPVVLIVDTGWAAAPAWPAITATLDDLIDRAGREERPVILAATAAGPDDAATAAAPQLATAEAARVLAAALRPVPWPPDRAAAVAAVMAMPALRDQPPAAVFWLGDGVADGDAEAMPALLTRLDKLGGVTVFLPETAALAMLVRPPERQGGAPVVAVERLGVAAETAWLRAVDDDGRVVARQPVTFAVGEGRARVALDLPGDLSQRIARLQLDPALGAAAVVLLDERWRRRTVGIVSDGGGVADELPLLGPAYYLDRAVEPFATVRRDSLEALLRRDVAMIALADAAVTGSIGDTLTGWVEAGGVLVRFAGPRLAGDGGADVGGGAALSDDPLLPVRLRPGDRSLGGALAWREPARLAPFAADGPFAGLAVPDDVEVRRQVLAEPTLDLDARTLARLDDGTPLITAAKLGEGHVVLVHTTADPGWSNLALSGLFVDLLERIAGLGRDGGPAAGGAPLRPLETLDGQGRLGPPPAAARPIEANLFAETRPGPRHPPGFYGRGDERRALNLGASAPPLRPWPPVPDVVDLRGYAGSGEVPLAPWLLAAALVLLLVDLTASLILRGVLRRPHFSRAAAAVVLAAAIGAGPATAQEVIADGSAVSDALDTRLAWIRTGDADVDAVSDAGLAGLSALIVRRTAADLKAPVGVDPEQDELSFYPLLYWPVIAGAAPPSERAAEALRTYLRNGGTILFDSRDQGGAARRPDGLAALAEVLDLPPLTPIPDDHVLGRAYYLLDQYPGRWTGGRIWVERNVSAVHDGVSAVVVGGHDWAGAWAVDARQRPMFAVVPGGERQRELAYRFGVNLVMHVLTGNYKADQVHLPAILERLKQ